MSLPAEHIPRIAAPFVLLQTSTEVHGLAEDQQAEFHYRYGYTLYKLKEFQRAKREFILCLQSGTSGPEPSLRYSMLAATSRKLGEHSEAAAFAAQAKSLKR